MGTGRLEGDAVSYEERDNQVILTMSREDYDILIEVLRMSTYKFGEISQRRAEEFVNRLNQGNPHYTPYQTEKEK